MKTQYNKGQGKNKGQSANNIVEAFKDLGGSTATSLSQDLLSKIPGDFMDQLFGPQKTANSGELFPGSHVEFNPKAKERSAEENKLKMQLSLERNLHHDERMLVQKRTNELKMQLKSLTDEVIMLAKSTQNLSSEVQIASMQVTAEPGVYHLFFFENIINFIRSFRGKIEDATLWMGTANKRAEKKNYWAKYKKHGSKFLLSADHYLTRSAG